MKRWIMAVGLWGLLCTAALAANITVAPTSVTSAAWVDLGAGPLSITRLTPESVFIMLADSAPAATDVGEPLDTDSNGGPAPITRVIYSSQHVWVRAIGRTASIASSPLDVLGSSVPTSSAANAVTPVASSALASSLVLKASAGNLYEWRVTSTTAAGYLMVFNATAAPADGAVTPLECVAVPVAASVGVTLPVPENYATGITLVFSTTGCYTKTASATAYLKGAAK